MDFPLVKVRRAVNAPGRCTSSQETCAISTPLAALRSCSTALRAGRDGALCLGVPKRYRRGARIVHRIAGKACAGSGPTINITSMRLRTSLSVVVIQPLSCSTRRLRNRPSLSRSSTTAPMRSARPRAARTPATSAAIPANSGARLRLRRCAARCDSVVQACRLPGDLPAHSLVDGDRESDRRLRSQPFSCTDKDGFRTGSITRSSQARAQKGQATSRTNVVPPFVMNTGRKRRT